jgi:hypothetical protein
MCWKCGEVLRYRRDLSVGACAPWELGELEPEARRILVSMVNRRREAIGKAALH